MRILVIEDDSKIQELVTRALREAGFAVDAASNAESALTLSAEQVHDVAIVDLGLPDMDGLDLIDALRQRGVNAPLLVLSARRSIEDRVKGLDSGGDDYLPKPFAIAELLARIRALIRRSASNSTTGTAIRVADLEIDLVRLEAFRSGARLQLSTREFRLLEYLAVNSGRVLTRTMILDHVWQMRFDPGTNVVDVHIHRLRKKVDKNFKVPLIHTVRGVGYVLRADD